MYLAHICGESLSEERILGLCDQLLIALLKHGGVDAGCAVLMAVLVHLVNEEQGQHLDTLVQIPQLLVQVGFDGAPDLRLLDDVLVHIANGLAQLDLLGVAELDMLKVWGAVDPGHGVAFIEISLAGQQEQIVSRLDGHGLSGHGSGLALHIQFHLGPKAFVVADGKQPHIGLVEATGNLIGGHGDLLDQPHLVGIHWGQAVEQIDFFPVGSGVPQNTQGVQCGNGFLGLGGVVHTLGFVNDDNGMGVLDESHGRFTIEPILGLIDDVLRFLEGVDVNNHHFDVGAGSELPHIRQLGRVVDEVPARHIVILQAKMLFGDFKGLVDTLPDGHRRHHDDKLGKPILAIQLKDGLGVNIGLAGAGFHLDTELAVLRRCGQRQVVPLLDGVHIGGQCLLVDVEGVALAHFREKGRLPLIYHGERAFGFLLPGKQIHHSVDRLGLEVLGLEF